VLLSKNETMERSRMCITVSVMMLTRLRSMRDY
jgi:hypothetical protein